MESVANDDEARGLLRKTHQTIKKVTDDIERSWHFNTAIAAVMELFNLVEAFDPKQPDGERFKVFKFSLEICVRLLSPFVPHIAEELWVMMGHEPTIFHAPWPKFDEEIAKEEEIEIPIQVNGKLRSRITVPADISDEELKQAVLRNERVIKYTNGKQIRKIILAKRKLVNVVTG